MKSQVDNKKRFFIHTLGCKVNQYESQVMREILLKAGFKECLSKDIADIYILNTCTVTERADRESRYWVGCFHKANPKAKILVTGCYVEKDADNLSFLPGISNILKNNEKFRIAEVLDPNIKAKVGPPATFTITDFKGHTKAFIKIQDGCENRCAYCKVSLVRTALQSKPLHDILEEAKTLTEKGFKEIVLAGICLGAWGKDLFPHEVARGAGLDGAKLADVLKALNGLRGDFRIRLSSIEPKYVTDELIDIVSDTKRICKHLHIPLQSGDDDILRRMNRLYTVSEYRALINKIRTKTEDIAITTDVMVGFPGESDRNFQNTVNFIKELIPLRTHIFTFSRRKGTAAYDMVQDLRDKTLKKRYYELKVAALGASYLYRRKFLNKKLDILVETNRDRLSELLVGYSGNYIKVLFKGSDELMNKIVPVMVEDLTLLHTLGVYDKD